MIFALFIWKINPKGKLFNLEWMCYTDFNETEQGMYL